MWAARNLNVRPAFTRGSLTRSRHHPSAFHSAQSSDGEVRSWERLFVATVQTIPDCASNARPVVGTALFFACVRRKASTRMGTALPSSDLRSADRRRQGHGGQPESQVVTVNDDLNIVAPDLTVIIPTRNERANVEPLLERLTAALGATPAEIIFVDDSDDDTADEIVRVGRNTADVGAPALPGPRPARGWAEHRRGQRTARRPGPVGAWSWTPTCSTRRRPSPSSLATARRLPVDLVVASRYAGPRLRHGPGRQHPPGQPPGPRRAWPRRRSRGGWRRSATR